MRSALRTLGATAPVGLVIAAAWLRLGQPLAPWWRAAALGALAVAPALLPRWSLRAAGAVVAAVVATWLALGVALVPRSLALTSGFGLGRRFAAVGHRFSSGFLDFYGTHLPFDPRVHVAMAEVVLVAIFSFTLLVALLAAARKPVLATLALLGGAAWPATLLDPAKGTWMGAAILAAGLCLLATLGSRRIPALAVPVAAVVVLGAVVVGSATAARHSILHWQTWNPAGAGGSAGVSFVWTPQYGGLDWPKKRTVVLEVKSRSRPAYLRATVLDDYSGEAWALGPPRPADSLEPAAALDPANQTKQVVTVDALDEPELVGGSIPVRFRASDPLVEHGRPGFAELPGGVAAGFHYAVWSYSPHPRAAALRRSPADYPAQLVHDGMLDVAPLRLPPFGTPGRRARVAQLLTQTPQLYPYLPLVRTAESVTSGARTPYGAVEALERWFLYGGGFAYSDHPQVLSPPLVGFVTQTHSGYCQFFAGAMALMLRYLGIPARVAVGFAGGTYDRSRGAWLVTDHDAHAWVEVWFRGYGWLPFDPTPAAPGSARDPSLSLPPGPTGKGGSSPGSKPGRHHGGGTNGHGGGKSGAGQTTPRQSGQEPGGGGGTSSGHGEGGVVLVLLLLVGATVGGIAATKYGAAYRRRRERDPRRLATACREELASFLADQRVELPASATLLELAALVRHEFAVEPAPFVAAATRARYGPVATAGEAAALAQSELRKLLRGCRRCLSRRERLRGLLSLRSLARRTATLDWSASVETVR